MEPTLNASVPATTGAVHFLNVENIFYLIYQWLVGAGGGSGTIAGSLSWVAPLTTTTWVVITIFAYLMALAFLALLAYSTIRMYQIKDDDAVRYMTIADPEKAEVVRDHNRWQHVMTLIESPQENDWRQAIIEADIILDDLLTQLGYPGDTVGEKLKAVDPSKFHTLQEAWDAHRVRNDIAHRGAGAPLTDQLAYRTIHHYENVFREHGEI